MKNDTISITKKQKIVNGMAGEVIRWDIVVCDSPGSSFSINQRLGNLSTEEVLVLREALNKLELK